MLASSYLNPVLPEAVEASRLAVTTRILRLAGGNAAFAAQMREMLWGEYCAAGAPLGRSEDAMMVWWDGQLDEQPA